MKSNLQYIFDQISRKGVVGAEWKYLDREALIELATAIAARDRGVAISPDSAGALADTLLASRTANPSEIRRLRARLSYDSCSLPP